MKVKCVQSLACPWWVCNKSKESLKEEQGVKRTAKQDIVEQGMSQNQRGIWNSKASWDILKEREENGEYLEWWIGENQNIFHCDLMFVVLYTREGLR